MEGLRCHRQGGFEMSKPSKFAGILRDRAHGSEPETTETKPKRGRPGGQGKRLNPDYSQVTAYIPTTLHDETKINLIRQGNREFSELVEELLAAWNKKQSAK
jgi:hypothetical protein